MQSITGPEGVRRMFPGNLRRLWSTLQSWDPRPCAPGRTDETVQSWSSGWRRARKNALRWFARCGCHVERLWKGSRTGF
jgi:hypothetical protein